MAGLSFGNFGSALPTGLDLSLGSSNLSPKVYSGRGSYGMPTVAKSPTDFQYSKTTRPAKNVQVLPNLSFGKSVPKADMGTFSPTPPLSYGKSGSTLGNIINSLPFSFGAPASPQPAYDDAILRQARITRPSPIATVPQVDTVTIDGAVNAADAAKDLASQIFGEMLTPASFGGGQSGGSGSGSGGFMDRLSTQDIVLIAGALGVAFLVLSGSSSGSRRRR